MECKPNHLPHYFNPGLCLPTKLCTLMSVTLNISVFVQAVGGGVGNGDGRGCGGRSSQESQYFAYICELHPVAIQHNLENMQLGN